ncbi:3' exoribonuclease, putative [Giardia lamblia P15]|uniref:3' exoribonuclease, putative n=1 Tax=Giardia intestinalis (strain P15) TaxID=658858 RepID=E1F9I7_GIAIA|nr:3' exoribonuclease, putative [Giardia lamblia P15]
MTRELRPDGREKLEHREPTILFNCISTSTGSVRFRLGGTDLIASVYLDTPQNTPFKLTVEALPTVSDAYRLTSNIRVLVGSVLSSIVLSEQKTCSLCVSGRSLLVLSLLILSDDGSTVASACNATLLMLMAIGVTLPYVPCAVSIGFTRTVDSRTMLIDPSKAEERALSGALTAVLDSITGDVLACVHSTAIHSTELRDILVLASSCSDVLSKSLFDHLSPTKTEVPPGDIVGRAEPFPKRQADHPTVGKYLKVPNPFEDAQ